MHDEQEERRSAAEAGAPALPELSIAELRQDGEKREMFDGFLREADVDLADRFGSGLTGGDFAELERRKKEFLPDIDRLLALKQDVLGNPEKNVLFGRILRQESEDDPLFQDIAQRMGRREWRREDLEAIFQSKDKLDKIFEHTREVEELMTSGKFDTVIALSPELRGLGLSPEKLKEAVKKSFKSVAASSPEILNSIVTAMQSIKDAETNMHERGERLEQSGLNYNTAKEKIAAALKLENPDERKQALTKALEQGIGPWRLGFAESRLGKLLGAGETGRTMRAEIERRLAEVNVKEELIALREEMDTRERGLGSILAAALTDHPDAAKMLNEYVTKGTMEEPEKKELPYAETKGVPRQQDMQREWEQLKKDKSWDDAWTDPAKDAVRNEFRAAQGKKYEAKTKKGGFWATIFKTLYEGIVTKVLA